MTSKHDLEDLAPSAELAPLFRHQIAGGASADTTAAGFAQLLPGLLLVAASVSVAFLVARIVPSISPLVASVAIGAALTNLGFVPQRARPGARFAAKRLLLVGVVLLGFQLAISDLIGLGAAGLSMVTLVVVTTFIGTRWLGEKLGVSRSLSLLIATGFSICGASAIAAVDGVADSEEEETAFAIALVTLCGSLAIVVLPTLASVLGLSGPDFGAWAGASVHDIAQVVATASTGGRAALDTAVVVKLTRIILLAPMVAAVTFSQRGAAAAQPPPTAGNERLPRTPLMPLFVAGFLAAVALRSMNVVPTAWLSGFKIAETLALSSALVGLGVGVQVSKLRKLGGRPLALAMTSWLLVATVSYVGVRLVGV